MEETLDRSQCPDMLCWNHSVPNWNLVLAERNIVTKAASSVVFLILHKINSQLSPTSLDRETLCLSWNSVPQLFERYIEEGSIIDVLYADLVCL